ncbi:hypothetical protein RHMOL_Rhmol05G0200600 [Rhododendron molle]|uniref:Uncharacterized protein n=1 Tax=Rhododendron molle TaxID=49168 RepID=A0ACC0NRE5_RHOML|nr:hypothetical protein RHMOL_Rhmol05G0200600 [Rhododendron molle]
MSRGRIRLKVVGIWWSSAIRGQRRNLLPPTEVTTISATHYISILKLAHRLKDENCICRRGHRIIGIATEISLMFLMPKVVMK